jgi:hypothetical protein
MSSNTTANGPAGNTSNNSNDNNSNNNNRNNNSNNGNRNNNNTNNTNRGTPWRGVNQIRGGADALRNFKGAIDSLPVLGTKIEKATQDFAKFSKAILNHVLTNFTYPQDIAYAITDLKNPMKRVTRDLPTKAKLLQENDLVLEDETTGSDAEKIAKAARNEDIEETIEYMRNAAFSEYNKRKTAVTSNMAALWGMIMGQYLQLTTGYQS